MDLLETLKAEKLKVDHWRDKEATRDAVRLTIQDYLWSEKTGLPETYSEAEVREKSEGDFRSCLSGIPPRCPPPAMQAWPPEEPLRHW